MVKSFEKRFHVGGPDDCWPAKGKLRRSGYWETWWNNRLILGHRLSWILHRGKIPEGMFVLHKCDNRACANPNHLFLGTQKDNMRDCANKGRTVVPKVNGEQVGNSKLKKDDVLKIREIYKKEKISCKKLGDIFGVSASNVCLILNKKLWRHI